MQIRNVILFVLIFAMGAISATLIYETGSIVNERPADILSNPAKAVGETLTAVAQGTDVSRASPGDSVKESQIHVYDNQVVLDIQNVSWSRFADTKSMEPVLDSTSNGIEVKPQSESDIHVGDIISYQSNQGIIIHRVISINNDTQGTYYTVKGDNNSAPDPVKVRFSDINGILVGIIY